MVKIDGKHFGEKGRNPPVGIIAARWWGLGSMLRSLWVKEMKQDSCQRRHPVLKRELGKGSWFHQGRPNYWLR